MALLIKIEWLLPDMKDDLIKLTSSYIVWIEGFNQDNNLEGVKKKKSLLQTFLAKQN